MKLEDISLHAFVQKYGIKTDTGERIDFRDHLFLFDIYSDQSPKQVILKAAQIGFSTLSIIKSLWLAAKRGLEIIYTLPTSDDAKAFVGSKVNRIIANNPVFKQFVKDHDTIEQKRVGENVIYYRGTWTERAAIMVSSDLNIYDEEDRSKREVIEQYDSRLQHSKYKWEWHFSNPSSQGNGVSRYWALSDQKEWFVTCDSCGEVQTLEWPKSIDILRKEFVCKACNAVLDREARRIGEWRKTANGEWSGYHISLLMAPWVTAKEIVEKSQTQSAEQFANFVLGLPYVGEGSLVSQEMFTRNLTPKINGQEQVIIGCDSGIKKHYVLGNADGLFYYDVTEDWEDIARLLNRFKGSVLVVDAMPDITGPRALRERFPGRVFLNHYAKDRKTMQLIRWGEGEEYGNVVSDRNRLLQLVIDEFSRSTIPLQGTSGDWKDFISHWLTLYRMSDVDAIGNPTFVWESSNGQDHWAHATAYWRIGMDKFGGAKGDIIGARPEVDVKTGPTISLDQRVPNPVKFILPDQEQFYDQT